MTFKEQEEAQKIQKTVAIYNMIPNLLWTVLFLSPITIFCYSFLELKTIFILLAVSMVPIFFPNSFFDRIQLSKRSLWYKKIGVKYINTFAQNGSILNRIIRKKYSNFRTVSRTQASIKKQYLQTYFFEKFHFSLFLFFLMVTIYAAVQSQFYWVLTFTLCNLIYNIYPNLLQQYIRVKLKTARWEEKLF